MDTNKTFTIFNEGIFQNCSKMWLQLQFLSQAPIKAPVLCIRLYDDILPSSSELTDRQQLCLTANLQKISPDLNEILRVFRYECFLKIVHISTRSLLEVDWIFLNKTRIRAKTLTIIHEFAKNQDHCIVCIYVNW